jgi:hypothetical protein
MKGRKFVCISLVVVVILAVTTAVLTPEVVQTLATIQII